MKKVFLSLLVLMCVCSLFAEGTKEKQEFPGKKQINIIVPYSAGGASDTTARIYASELEKAIGTTVTVSNITGASGATGLTQVKNSKPDGYTLAYMPVESTMLRALGLTKLSSDDFSFIGRAMTIPAAVTVRADSPWKTFDDFIKYAKEHPSKVRVGNSGTGSIWHGEPGVWNGPLKTADELALESLETIFKDMPVEKGREVAVLINGLGATSIEELYILSNSVAHVLENKAIGVYRTFVGEFATSMVVAQPANETNGAATKVGGGSLVIYSPNTDALTNAAYAFGKQYGVDVTILSMKVTGNKEVSL